MILLSYVGKEPCPSLLYYLSQPSYLSLHHFTNNLHSILSILPHPKLLYPPLSIAPPPSSLGALDILVALDVVFHFLLSAYRVWRESGRHASHSSVLMSNLTRGTFSDLHVFLKVKRKIMRKNRIMNNFKCPGVSRQGIAYPYLFKEMKFIGKESSKQYEVIASTTTVSVASVTAAKQSASICQTIRRGKCCMR